MKTGTLTLIIVMLLSPAAVADKKGVIWPDCFCTDKTGTRVELGQSICMSVDGRNFTARCEMSLNNPMWRETGDSCLSSSNELFQSLDPIFDTGAVNPKI